MIVPTYGSLRLKLDERHLYEEEYQVPVDDSPTKVAHKDLSACKIHAESKENRTVSLQPPSNLVTPNHIIWLNQRSESTPTI